MHGVIDQRGHVFASGPSHPQRDELGIDRPRAARPRGTLGPFLARHEELGGPERGDGLRQRVRRGLRDRVPLSAVEGSGAGPTGDGAVPGASRPGVRVRGGEQQAGERRQAGAPHHLLLQRTGHEHRIDGSDQRAQTLHLERDGARVDRLAGIVGAAPSRIPAEDGIGTERDPGLARPGPQRADAEQVQRDAPVHDDSREALHRADRQRAEEYRGCERQQRENGERLRQRKTRRAPR